MFPSSSLLSLDSPSTKPSTTQQNEGTSEQNIYDYQNPWINKQDVWNPYWNPTFKRDVTPPLALQTAPIMETPESKVPDPAIASSVMFTPESPEQSPEQPKKAPVRPQENPQEDPIELEPNNLKKRKKVEKKEKEHKPDDKKYVEVEGRMPTVGGVLKYNLDMEQMKRRIEAPESMNTTQLMAFFKKSKTRENMQYLKSLIDKTGLKIAPMQRQKAVTAFTPLIEQEACTLAQDVQALLNQYFPTISAGRKMLDNLLATGKHPEQCLESLKNSVYTLNQIIRTLQSRQPAISQTTEKIKRDFVDLEKDQIHQNLNQSYEDFSRMTHGFGHINSLAYYKTYVKVFEEAIDICQLLVCGIPLQPRRQLGLGEDPWVFRYIPKNVVNDKKNETVNEN